MPNWDSAWQVQRVAEGHSSAIQPIWHRYRDRLLLFAKAALRRNVCRASDEEDVLQSAMISFWKRASEGRFPGLKNSQNLLALMKVIIQRKASDYRAHQQRLKRGGGKVRGQSALLGNNLDCHIHGTEHDTAARPGPASIVATEEAAMRLLDVLHDDTLRHIAVLKSEGHTNEEVASLIGCSRSTVVRKLVLIRKIWELEVE